MSDDKKATGNRHERRSHASMNRRRARAFARLQRSIEGLQAKLATRKRKPGQPKAPSKREIRRRAEALLAAYEGR